ncbi:hypothetical protein [Psychrobacter lutiphocae]|uniref:hypothetical protein n=1 Tax=Psychrobacter lutiphocae TaxID=540500 RepID=UPI00036ECE83|nr:hypothetical protein [Psychrobacter lutiphocae]
MKKVLAMLPLSLLFSISAQASMSYECWTYKNGSPDKMTKVSANNKSEAESKAKDKFQNDLNISFDFVKCK